MGTVFEITVARTPQQVAEPAMARAMGEIARLEDVLSEWRAGSEISEINRQAGVGPVHVGEDTLAVVRAGLQVSRWSDGAFDMSWAALRGLYRFQPGDRQVPSSQEVAKRLRLVNFRNVIVDEEAHTVYLRRKGMAIGTGGIAKGYALDQAASILRAAGIENFMLFGGGQVQVQGQRGDRPWRVGIQHPRAPDYFAFLEATSGSISTSGDYERFFVDAQGTRWHHILDLRTGLPARGSLSVTWLAPKGIFGDALSTACFVLGPEGCLKMTRRQDLADHAMLLVDPRFRLHQTQRFEERLHYRIAPEDDVLPATLPGSGPAVSRSSSS